MERFVTIMMRNVARTGTRGSGFVRLFVSKRLLHGAAAALVGIFLPIYLYESTESFLAVALFYGLASLGYALLLPPGMHITNRIGFSRTLILGAVFAIGTYICLYFSKPETIYTYLPWILITTVLFRLFHWVPYHVDFALFTTPGERGKDVSLVFATIAFLGVIGPILAGFIINQTSYNTLFAIVIALLAASAVSYMFVPETAAHFEWSSKETFKRMFDPSVRGLVIGAMAAGAEVIVTLVVWPVFLYELLNGDVLEIGMLSTVIVLLTIGLQLAIGRYIDRGKGQAVKTLRYGSFFYSLGWLLKIFVLSSLQVFLIGLYHNITKIFTVTPMHSILYDMTGDQTRYVDELTVLREMANHIGRVISLILVMVLALFVTINWTFLIAAAASIAFNMVYRYSR